jgi:hypothetical protein
MPQTEARQPKAEGGQVHALLGGWLFRNTLWTTLHTARNNSFFWQFVANVDLATTLIGNAISFCQPFYYANYPIFYSDKITKPGRK